MLIFIENGSAKMSWDGSVDIPSGLLYTPHTKDYVRKRFGREYFMLLVHC